MVGRETGRIVIGPATTGAGSARWSHIPATLQSVSTTMLPRLLLSLVWALPLVMAGADDGPGDQAFK